MYKTVTVQNANQDILSPTKMVNKLVHNVTMLIVLSVKIMLVTVKHVFSDTLYISLNKFVKSQLFPTVNQSSMEDAKFAMMDIE